MEWLSEDYTKKLACTYMYQLDTFLILILLYALCNSSARSSVLTFDFLSLKCIMLIKAVCYYQV